MFELTAAASHRSIKPHVTRTTVTINRVFMVLLQETVQKLVLHSNIWNYLEAYTVST